VKRGLVKCRKSTIQELNAPTYYTISDFRDVVCVYALIMFLANLLRKRVCLNEGRTQGGLGLGLPPLEIGILQKLYYLL